MNVTAAYATTLTLSLLYLCLTVVKVVVALRSERGRFVTTHCPENEVLITSLEQSELDKVEKIDMIAKMFESS